MMIQFHTRFVLWQQEFHFMPIHLFRNFRVTESTHSRNSFYQNCQSDWEITGVRYDKHQTKIKSNNLADRVDGLGILQICVYKLSTWVLRKDRWVDQLTDQQAVKLIQGQSCWYRVPISQQPKKKTICFYWQSSGSDTSIFFSHLLNDSLRGFVPGKIRNAKIWTKRNRWSLSITAYPHPHIAPAYTHYCPCPPANDYLLAVYLALFKIKNLKLQ